MSRWFNTAGPCNPDDHYMVPVLRRLPQVRRLIEQRLYFVLHAPRQVGKTTTLLALARELTAEGHYAAVLLTMETGAPFSDDPGDSLAERLREPRVRRIIEPMLAGGTLGDLPADDIRFIQDLGLARMSKTGGLEIANPIYAEVVPRCLAITTRASLPSIAPTWLTADGRLDAGRLLDAFLDFWRQHGDPPLGTSPYHEVAAQLVLMTFLHRVANGGGTVEREYAIGRGRIDLCLRYGPDTVAMELKVQRDGQPDPVAKGLTQLDAYLAGLGLPSGWLVIFDHRSGLPPISDRTTSETAISPGGRTITVIRA